MKYLIFLVFFISCASSKTVIYDATLPDQKRGCGLVRGTQFFECLKKQSERWDKIESSVPTDTILSETREGNYVHRKIRTCRHDLCHEKSESVYDPSLWYLIAEKVGLTAIGFLFGKFI